MLTRDFYFDLPQELIAQKPSAIRGKDRLMTLNKKTGEIAHHLMQDLPLLVESGTVMIFNDSKVRQARVYAHKVSSNIPTSKVEFIFISCFQNDPTLWQVMVKPARKQHIGDNYIFEDNTTAFMQEKTKGGELAILKFYNPIDENFFIKTGHVPLPPYIKRKDTPLDTTRYQNIYAKNIGSAACPTAGLHFTSEMLRTLTQKNIQLEYITLHVGLGTFLPVREKNIEEHNMHTEIFTITQQTASNLNRAKKESRPILAVGTTCARTLESAIDNEGKIQSGTHSTNIFIYPGYNFRFIDKLFTNFHTPESTLLMLVSAFASKEKILAAYHEAIKEKYHFFSYGDAMLIY